MAIISNAAIYKLSKYLLYSELGEEFVTPRIIALIMTLYKSVSSLSCDLMSIHNFFCQIKDCYCPSLLRREWHSVVRYCWDKQKWRTFVTRCMSMSVSHKPYMFVPAANLCSVFGRIQDQRWTGSVPVLTRVSQEVSIKQRSVFFHL